jgi:hypothetical protein
MTEAELVHQILLQLFCLFVIFGIPLVALVIHLSSQTAACTKQRAAARKRRLELEDAAFIAAHGAEAYAKLQKDRQASQPDLFEKLATGRLSGVLYSNLTPATLAKTIEFYHGQFGTSPVCWTQFWPATLNYEIYLRGQWPNPLNEEITSWLTLKIKLVGQVDGRTALKFSYQASPHADPFARQLIQMTNWELEHICSLQ